MARDTGDHIFDVEAMQSRKAEAARGLRDKPSRNRQKSDPGQLEFFSSAYEILKPGAAAPISSENNAEAGVPIQKDEIEKPADQADIQTREHPVAPRDTPPGGASASRDTQDIHRPDAKPNRPKILIGSLAPSAIEDCRPSRDYRITAESKIGQGSLREKAELNLRAISLLKSVERDARTATEDEKHILARYTGWGAMPAVFDTHTGRHDEWTRIRDSVRELLTEDEFRAARASVPNAHYTSPVVVEAIWQGLEHMGLTAGARILEPSCGTGNFFGLMPEHLLRSSTRAGVEIDPITARIATALYPDTKIYGTAFEETALPDGFFDAAVGNVPFGKYGVHDPRYKAWQTASIHNYFFIKALDKLRDGGLLALITSRYTMDETDTAIRAYISTKADFLGAIRLPNSSFKSNAGTVVTTDIIFLRKRGSGQEQLHQDWRDLAEFRPPKGGDSFPINEYFVRHPSMMLGSMEVTHGAFGMQPELIGQISSEKLHAAIESGLPRLIYRPRSESAGTGLAPIQPLDQEDLKGVKNGSYVVINDVLKQRKDDALVPVDCGSKIEARIRGMIKIRDCVREVFKTQLADESDASIVAAREKLGTTYDRFVLVYGCLSSRENRRALGEDPDAPLLLSLEENYDETAGTAKKAAIFAKRTLERYKPVERVDTAAEALAVSLNEFGRLDWDRMSTLTGYSAPELQCELGDLIYENPQTTEWETADRYLSGNVRQKLTIARQAAGLNRRYRRNVAALEAVQPVDLVPHEITARLGATWIPPDDIADFFAMIVDAEAEAVRIDYQPDLAIWIITAKESVKSGVANVTTHGTSRFTALDLIDDALNGKFPTAYDILMVDGQEKRCINERQTLEAREAQQKLKDRFISWIWNDDERAARLAAIYNQKFNALRLRTYDGSHLTFPEMNKAVLRDGDLAPHQKNAVWRIIQGDSTLLAHCVGAGKTWIMTAAAMEAKRIGLTKKSMIVVPNHLVEQWGAAFLQLYPQANIFVAGKEYFQTGNRERAMSRIATGNYDAVIVSHRSFELLPVSDELFERYLQIELDALEDAICEASAGSNNSRRIVKMLETAKKRLIKKIQDRSQREKKDVTITFEELGIDRIFVDEADLYKNLGFVTKMSRVAGLPQTTSNRATDMHLKTRWLRERNNGKGVVFATGTPISNTMAELYTMQRYLAPEALAETGMAAFDAWAANFGETVTALELAPSGSGYRMHTRFAKFVNLPELLTMFRDFADVQTPEMLNLPRPALRGGCNRIITSPSTPALKKYVESLIARSENIRTGSIDPSIDNMLKITSDGRKAALDMRLIDPSCEVDARSKVGLVTKEIFEIWQQTARIKSTQLAFCDISTPHPDRFHVYGAIQTGLVELGIPSNEICFIHDAQTDAEKQALFDRPDPAARAPKVARPVCRDQSAASSLLHFQIALPPTVQPWPQFLSHSRPSTSKPRQNICRSGAPDCG